MAREVNVWTSNWRATGGSVSVPQYELKVRVQWTDDDGTQHEQELTVRFPNVLAQMPTRYVAERMKDMLLDYARYALGIDTLEDD